MDDQAFIRVPGECLPFLDQSRFDPVNLWHTSRTDHRLPNRDWFSFTNATSPPRPFCFTPRFPAYIYICIRGQFDEMPRLNQVSPTFAYTVYTQCISLQTKATAHFYLIAYFLLQHILIYSGWYNYYYHYDISFQW